MKVETGAARFIRKAHDAMAGVGIDPFARRLSWQHSFFLCVVIFCDYIGRKSRMMKHSQEQGLIDV